MIAKYRNKSSGNIRELAQMSNGEMYDGQNWLPGHLWELVIEEKPKEKTVLFKTNIEQEEVIDLSKITNMWKNGGGGIKAMLTSGDTTCLTYRNMTDRDQDYNAMVQKWSEINQQIKLQGEPAVASSNEPSFLKGLVGDTRGFIAEHKNIIYTIAILFLVDHFIFDGGFRAKLKGLVDKLINKVESKIDGQ